MNDKPCQVLKKLLADHGMSLAGDRGRCSALLRDLCCDYKAETNLLIVAMDESIPAALVKDCNSGPVRLLVERLTKRLQDDRHLTRDAALWAVESWVFALGIAEENTKPTPPASNTAPTPKENPSGKPGIKQDVPMEEFYKAFIGPNNQDYYLRHFERFDRKNKASWSWNWSAFFLGFLWFLYRKMWRSAFLYYLLIPLIFVMSIPALELVDRGVQNLIWLLIYIFYGWKILISLPLNANAHYYRYCQKQIDKVKSLANDSELQLQKLASKGGTGGLELFFLSILLYFGVGVLALTILGK